MTNLVKKLESHFEESNGLDELKSLIKYYDGILAELGEENLLTDSEYVASIYETEKFIEAIHQAVK